METKYEAVTSNDFPIVHARKLRSSNDTRNHGTNISSQLHPKSHNLQSSSVSDLDGQQMHQREKSQPPTPDCGPCTNSPAAPGLEGDCKFWNPVWLHRITLLGFAVLFGSMCFTIIVLYYVSRRQNGLSTQVTTNRYSWTYGPTAIFVVVTSFWWKVDYWCKVLVPWQTLQRGYSTAQKTVLLDYVSPVLPSVLYSSVKNRDWAVVASSCGYILLKLLIIFSTGLLTLEPTTVRESSVVLKMPDDFDATKFNPDLVGAQPLQTYYGVQTQTLPYPLGTTDDVIVPRFFSQRTSVVGTTFSADVQGLNVALDCEIVQPSNTTIVDLPWRSITADFLVVNISTPTCRLLDVLVGEGVSHYPAEVDITQNYQGWFSNVTCNDGMPVDTWSPGSRPVKENFTDYRLVMTAADVRWNAEYPRTTWIQQITTVLCKPTYGLDSYLVSFPQSLSGAQQSMEVSRTGNESSSLPGLTNGKLTAALRNTADQTFFGYAGQALPFGPPIDPLFQLMALMNANSSIKSFLNSTTLIDIGSKAVQGTMTQIVFDSLMQPVNRTILGSSLHSEERLQVKIISVAFMASFLALLSINSLFVLYLHPRDAVPCNPESLSAAATLLASSTRFQALLSTISASECPSLQTWLPLELYRSFESVNAKTFGIETNSRFAQPNSQPEVERPANCWQPLALKLPLALLTVLLPLILIALLEILQHLSASRDGLFDVPNPGSQLHVLMTYLPAMVLIGVAALYTSLQFGVAVFAPFAALKRCSATATRSITMNIVGKTYFHALAVSIQARCAGPCFSICAAFVASFLTVVVSGLYSIENVPLVEPTDLLQMDRFNFTQTDLFENDNFAGVTTNLIVYQNLTYPQWTYDNLVFPAMKMPETSISPSNTSSMSVILPAVRPSLECTVFAPLSVKYIAPEVYGYGSGFALVDFAVNITWPCQLYSNPSAVVGASYGVFVNHSVVHVGAANTMSWTINEGLTDVTYNSGCPTVTYSLGTASAQGKVNASNGFPLKPVAEGDIFMFSCYQHLEEVMTNVTLRLPSMSIDPLIPPVPIEKTAKLLDIQSGNYTGPVFAASIDQLLQSLTNSGLSAGIGPVSYGNYETSTKDYLEPFIQALVHGKDGIPLSELTGAANVPRLMSAANKLYQTYMAQAINANFRVPVVPTDASQALSTNTTTTTNTTYTATLISPDRQRVKQSAAVKIALQAMLSFMAACAVVVYVLADTKEVLRMCPCSIAGAMSLLAGSEMASRHVVPVGSEWLSDRERRKAVWDGYKFSMRWWGARYGIDVVGFDMR